MSTVEQCLDQTDQQQTPAKQQQKQRQDLSEKYGCKTVHIRVLSSINKRAGLIVTKTPGCTQTILDVYVLYATHAGRRLQCINCGLRDSIKVRSDRNRNIC